MKAGAYSEIAAQLDCMLANIPFKRGFARTRWRHCIDVMITKHSGVTQLSGLQTIFLFPADCNYVFKHIGRKMMVMAEKTKSLAPEQYGSRKQHKAIDLAVNKALAYDNLQQQKRPGALCSNDAKTCYDRKVMHKHC
jgi:hypothetical protein